jgi:hypothetical protein
MARELLLGLGERQVDGMESHEAYFGIQKKGMETLALVAAFQAVAKDAWLTHIGHKRPGMATGISLNALNAERQQFVKKMADL